MPNEQLVKVTFEASVELTKAPRAADPNSTDSAACGEDKE